MVGGHCQERYAALTKPVTEEKIPSGWHPHVRLGSTIEFQLRKYDACWPERPFCDPQADLGQGHHERPFLAEGCLSPFRLPEGRFGSKPILRRHRQEGLLPEVKQTKSGAKRTMPLEGRLSGVKQTKLPRTGHWHPNVGFSPQSGRRPRRGLSIRARALTV